MPRLKHSQCALAASLHNVNRRDVVCDIRTRLKEESKPMYDSTAGTVLVTVGSHNLDKISATINLFHFVAWRSQISLDYTIRAAIYINDVYIGRQTLRHKDVVDNNHLIITPPLSIPREDGHLSLKIEISDADVS